MKKLKILYVGDLFVGSTSLSRFDALKEEFLLASTVNTYHEASNFYLKLFKRVMHRIKLPFDACAANKVVIELNAHPYRLDIDWRWIPYCLEKGVMISINPDAHQLKGYHDMRYGTLVARKGMLTKEQCLNAMDLNSFESFLKNYKK